MSSPTTKFKNFPNPDSSNLSKQYHPLCAWEKSKLSSINSTKTLKENTNIYAKQDKITKKKLSKLKMISKVDLEIKNDLISIQNSGIFC